MKTSAVPHKCIGDTRSYVDNLIRIRPTEPELLVIPDVVVDVRQELDHGFSSVERGSHCLYGEIVIDNSYWTWVNI